MYTATTKDPLPTMLIFGPAYLNLVKTQQVWRQKIHMICVCIWTTLDSLPPFSTGCCCNYTLQCDIDPWYNSFAVSPHISITQSKIVYTG